MPVCRQERSVRKSTAENIQPDIQNFSVLEMVYMLWIHHGFTSLRLPAAEKEEVKDYYPEFQDYIGECRFWDVYTLMSQAALLKRQLKRERFPRTDIATINSFMKK